MLAHGDIAIYTHDDTPEKKWVEYLARFTHGRVEWIQPLTEEIVRRLRALELDQPLNPWFLALVERGTGKPFKDDDNARWMEVTAPILQAYFHARSFLEMAVRYGELETPPDPLPSGYAVLLCLYGLR